MTKISLLRSLRDLTARKAEKLCSKDKPHFKQFLKVYEKVVVDDLVEKELLSENIRLVEPILTAFAKQQSEIPIPFFVSEKQVSKIRVSSYWLEVAANDSDDWHHLYGKDLIRLYEALDDAGYLDNLE
jgi:hypothetical protein